ncbi:hypothetical protein [Nocardia otitidiscaviarum]|uniref:hypothetical protein n=1 Tax=Nocardia otitidiscaviarum TaxID=1823 RepID=UPI001896129B|nr:hypothetical protein [Nocardia otitidiscaviarum]MBF6239177.1 hypothetical protein [Nocardia otitidiscaviarum]
MTQTDTTRTDTTQEFVVTVVRAFHCDGDGFGDKWVATNPGARLTAHEIAAALADPRTARVWCDDCGNHAHRCPDIREQLPPDLRTALEQARSHYAPTVSARYS